MVDLMHQKVLMINKKVINIVREFSDGDNNISFDGLKNSNKLKRES